MKRNKEDINGDITMILRDGDGARLWKVFQGGLLPKDDAQTHSSTEARFLLLIERYMAKHRFTIATAHGRYLVRKSMKPIRKWHHTVGPVVRLPIPNPPATM